MRTPTTVLVSCVLASLLGQPLILGARAAAGIDRRLQHAYDIPGAVLAAKYGFTWQGTPGTNRQPPRAEVWVSQSLVGPRELDVVKHVVDEWLNLRAERMHGGGCAPSTIRVIGTLLSNGTVVMATVYKGTGEYSVQAFDAPPSGLVKGPIVTDEFSSDIQDAFIVHDESTVTALVVTSTDRFGMLQSTVVFANGTRKGFAGAEVAEVKRGDSTSAIMLVSDIDKGMDVLRIIEVTDHIEDLVAPVRVRTLGDPRREPNLTGAEWKQRRDAMNAMRLKFQQIVLSRGVRPPHMPVHVGDPEAKGSRPHPVPRSTAVPK